MSVSASRATGTLFSVVLARCSRSGSVEPICGHRTLIYRSFSLTKLEFPIDDRITASRVRLLREGRFVGDFDIAEAKKQAQDAGLNLILFRPRADPPICILAKYQEFLEQQRSLRDKGIPNSGTSSASPQTFAFDPSLKVKVVQISAQCAESDFQRKIQGARKFLESGHRVEIIVFAKSARKQKGAATTLGTEDARKIEAGMPEVVASAAKKNAALAFSLDNPLIQRVDYIYANLADLGRPYTLRNKVDTNQRQLVLKFWPV